MEAARELAAGIHGVSNGPPEAQWVKVERGVAAMRESLTRDDLTSSLLEFFGTPTPDEPIEHSVFVLGERYGTRSSTAITVGDDGVQVIEQNWLPAHSLALPISTTSSLESLRSGRVAFFIPSRA